MGKLIRPIDPVEVRAGQRPLGLQPHNVCHSHEDENVETDGEREQGEEDPSKPGQLSACDEQMLRQFSLIGGVSLRSRLHCRKLVLELLQQCSLVKNLSAHCALFRLQFVESGLQRHKVNMLPLGREEVSSSKCDIA